MSSEVQKFSVELVKLAAQSSERKPKSYASAALAALPFAAAKGAIDVPKGMIDKAVDSAIRTGKKPNLRGIAGRGIGRGLGSFGPAIFTTPVFLGGLKQLSQAKGKKDKREGMAKILGAGFAYSALKGATEVATEKGLKGIGAKEIARVARNVGGVRGIVGVGSAASVGLGIIRNRRKPEESFKKDMALGLTVGAGKGALDELAEKGLKTIKAPKGLRDMAARAGGRAAAGAVGAVALGKIFDAYMKKTSSVSGPLAAAANYSAMTSMPSDTHPTPTPGAVYDQLSASARNMPTTSVYSAYAAHVARGNPESNPMRRAVHYALTDSLKARGQNVPEPKMREQVAPKQISTAIPAAAMVGALSAPPLLLGFMDALPKTDKERLLSESLDAQILSRNIDYFKEAPDSIWGDEIREVWDKNIRGRSDGVSGRNPVTGRRLIMVGPEAGAATKAHELGHASAGTIRSSLLQNNIVRGMAQMGQISSVVIPLAALFMAGDKSFATPREIEAKKRFVESAGKVGAMAMAPKLLEEAMASIKAVKYLRRAEIAAGTAAGDALPKAISRSLKRLGPAFLTYAAPLALPVMAARHLERKADEAEKRLYRKVHSG
jgi:hypothetical protein